LIVLTTEALSIDKQIIYEDNHLIAVNKNAGQLVQPDNDFTEESLEDYIKEYIRVKYRKPGEAFLGVIHRLDRPVSGVCVFARTGKALERMNRLFSGREVRKVYWAVVQGKPPADKGKLVNWLIKDTERNIVRAYNNDKRGGVRAELDYKLLRQAHGYSLLEVVPHTGRPHQIRVQLAKMGNVIAGDLKYGSDAPNPDRSVCLHAHQLEFIHPVKKEMLKLVALPAADNMIRLLMDQ
jgi:23S rRNA pseudouridine1911/1915/1917 synthase